MQNVQEQPPYTRDLARCVTRSLPKLKVVIEGIHFDMDQKGHDKQPSENPENVTRRGKRVAWIENGEYHSPRVGLSAH